MAALSPHWRYLPAPLTAKGDHQEYHGTVWDIGKRVIWECQHAHATGGQAVVCASLHIAKLDKRPQEVTTVNRDQIFATLRARLKVAGFDGSLATSDNVVAAIVKMSDNHAQDAIYNIIDLLRDDGPFADLARKEHTR